MPRSLRLFVLLAIVSGIVIACGSGDEDQVSTEKADEWAAVQSENDALRALRAELQELRAQAEAGFDEAAEDGTSPEEQQANLEAVIESKTAEVNSDADAFNGVLVEFINKYAGFEGEEIDEIQLQAIQMKSDEDIELALDYIRRGGDYKRAIDILTNALMVDPDNERLKAEIEAAEEARYMDEERFARVTKGMTQAQVAKTIGQVFYRNIREQEDRGVTTWLYPRLEGAAAAVYFRKSGETLVVYETNFEAVKPAAERVE